MKRIISRVGRVRRVRRVVKLAASLSLLALASLLSACVTVRPEQRSVLADPTMRFEGDVHAQGQLKHALDNREGSTGGGGVAGEVSLVKAKNVILATSILDARRGVSTSRLETELNQRVAMALSPIAFLLLGMPLAIRTSRRETAIGLFLSVILGGAYFGIVLTSDALQSRPE